MEKDHSLKKTTKEVKNSAKPSHSNFINKNRLQFSNEEKEQENGKNTKLMYKKKLTLQQQKKTKQPTSETSIRSKSVQIDSKQKQKKKLKQSIKAKHSLKMDALRIGNKVVSSSTIQKKEEKEENVAVEATHSIQKNTLNGTRLIQKNFHNRKAKKIQKTKKLKTKLMQTNHYERALKENPAWKTKNPISKNIQKKAIKKKYASAYRSAKSTTEKTLKSSRLTTKIARKLQELISIKKKAFIAIGIGLMVFVLFSTLVSTVSMMLTQSSAVLASSTYLSDDKDIHDAELYYTQLETQLQEKIQNVEHDHKGFDEYRYNIPPIQHSPFTLINYLSAKYPMFKFAEVKEEIHQLFNAQYNIDYDKKTETKTEKKKVKVGDSLGQVTTSAYCSCPICTGIWSGGPTASGVMPKANHTIAVDAYTPTVPMGTKVIMEGIEYTVEDTGAFSQFGVDFDVYFDDHQTALQWGHRKLEAYLADNNGNGKEIEVTTEVTVEVLNTSVQARSMDAIIQKRLTDDQKELYKIYEETKGNRQFFGSPFDFNWTTSVSSMYGYRMNPTSAGIELHRGLDIAAPLNTPIKAIHTGKVTTGYDPNGFGNYVVIENIEKEYKSIYAHCEALNVNNGQEVKTGDTIAFVGSTGNSTGAHLHLEFLYQNEYMNPYFYLMIDERKNPTNNLGNHGEAMNDPVFKNLIEYAEQYLGFPYVFGGSSPETSFDCSGFICWVYTNSGTYNLPRTTAQGIYNQCAPVSPEEAKPGDLIFFEGTYDAGEPVTHIGIYVGNGQMLHCGDPIQYTSINDPYWSSHFYGFGRLK